jgi:hypothetical protein
MLALKEAVAVEAQEAQETLEIPQVLVVGVE